MISFLHGKLVESLPTQVTLDLHGVGYEVLIPLSTFHGLPAVGSDVRLLTQLIVREDSHTLYGFATRSERDMFRLLIHTVSGIGPKLALGLLSGISVNSLRAAVANRDIKALSSISGVGKKTAERIIVELGDKVGVSSAWETGGALPSASPGDQRTQDAVLALLALGYKQPEALESIRAVQTMLGAEASVEDLVRASLKRPRG